MRRASKRGPIVGGGLVALLLALSIVVGYSFPVLTALRVFTGLMVGLFLLVGIWLVSQESPRWLAYRLRLKAPGSVRFTGLMFILIAVDFAIALANSLFAWHAIWPLYAVTLITLVGVVVSVVLAARQRRHPGPF
jgi:MFS family permease